MKELASPEEVAAMGQFLIEGSVWRLALQIHFTLEQLGSASPTGSEGTKCLVWGDSSWLRRSSVWTLWQVHSVLKHTASILLMWFDRKASDGNSFHERDRPCLQLKCTGGLWWCACYRRRDRMGRIQDLWLQDPRLLRGLPCHPEKVLLRCWLPVLNVLIAGNGCLYVAQRSDLNLGSEVSISASDSERSQPAKPS